MSDNEKLAARASQQQAAAGKRGRQKATADELEKRFAPKSMTEWVKEHYPSYWRAVEREARTARQDPTKPGASFDYETLASGIINTGRYADTIKADYQSYKNRQADELGHALAEAQHEQKVAPDYEIKNPHLDRTRVERSQAKARAGITAGRTATGTGFDPTAVTSGKQRFNVDYGNLATVITASPNLGGLLGSASQASIFGDKAAAAIGPQPERIITTALTGEREANERARDAQRDQPLAAPILMGSGAPGSDAYEQARAAAHGATTPFTGGSTGNVTLGRALNYLTGLDRSDLVRLQQHFVSAGLYDENDVKENRILWGVATDPGTVQAWQQLLTEQLQDPKSSVASVLYQREVAYAPRLAAILTGAASGAAGTHIEVNLSDPDTIAQAADQYFVQSLGRLPTEDEKKALVGAIHSAQTAVGQQKLAAVRSVSALPGGTAVQPGNRQELDALLAGSGSSARDAQFLGAVRQHESGGNYRAKNPHGSASGAYQFIDSTWRGYADRLGIKARRAMDASPAEQDRVAQAYLNSLKGIGNDPRLWAAGWYVGPGLAAQIARGQLPWNYTPGGNNGLSVGSYANWIASHMGLPGVGAGAGGNLPVGPNTPGESERVAAAQNRLDAVTDVDVESSIAEAAKRDHPVEYGAQQLSNSYQDLVKLLAGEAVSK